MARKYRASVGPSFRGCREYGTQPGGAQQMNGSVEWIDSVGHNLGNLGKSDCGGPMLLKRDKWDYSPVVVSGGYYQTSQLVMIYGDLGGGIHHPVAAASDSSMFASGATGISRTIPTAPSFEAITALRELQTDGFPSAPGVQAWRDRSKAAKASGSEYLNVQFGWIPLVSDMRRFAKTVVNHHKILSDLRSGSKKVTRVGYSFPSTYESTSGSGNISVYYPLNSGISSTVPGNWNCYQENRTWFNGAFSYYLPASDTQLGKAALYAEYANKLLGVKPTPSNIWNAAPWTWALDWFTNAGDVVKNISQMGHDGLVLKYGYIMSRTSTKTTLVTGSQAGFSGFMSAGSVTHLEEWKKRMPANPYGFGVTGDSLSNAQKAVIAALGLSHSHGHG
ncbi:TPA_asm: maturation protein [ssRNA phage Esthiorhiza.4_17]|uniref:Maturation protein n=2 Tax=Leviviricetes TaxID=2842243 RepID=A0A8S5L2W4_9VIRU|nr:maturation protein [ssRNA phage Esthiorhiza.4_17]QDH90713.1 MAG: hypothetical protein H4RhizoLitter21627_000003 [Leviviridae sp.]DAD51835.1 TPA_asm: maturation protein [ssRNA phage Esthiorhiza.4_17]